MSQSSSRVRKAFALFVLSLLWVNLPVLVFADARQVQAQTVDEQEAEADRLFQQGMQQWQSSQIQAAIQSWQQALQLYQELGDRKGAGNVSGKLGLAYRFLAEYEKAIEFFQQSLELAREIGDRALESKFLNDLARVYGSRGEYEKAIEFHQQSLELARKVGDRILEGTSLNDLGEVSRWLAQYERAISFSQQALGIQQEIGNRAEENRTLNTLGFIYLSLGQNERAISFSQQALGIQQEIGNRAMQANSFNNLGLAYSSIGNYQKALEFHKQSLAIDRELGNRLGEGNSLNSLGNVYQSLGEYKTAIDLYQQSLAIKREFGDRVREVASLSNLGLVYYYLEDYKKAIEFFQQALDIDQELGDRRGEACGCVLNNLGLALYKSGQLAKAEETLLEATQVRESIRAQLEEDKNKVSIFENQTKTYRLLQQVLIAQNKTDRALEIAERGRARAFVELLAQRISPETSSQPPNIEQIKQIAREQNATLVEYSIIKDDLEINGKKEWRESQLYIWVVKPTGEVSFRTADLTELSKKGQSLSKLVTRSRNYMGVRSRGIIAVPVDADTESINRLHQLHQLLIEPIADLLPTDPQEKIIFMPQGALFLVPFPALQDKDLNYLIEQHTILTAPAIQVLQLTREQRQRVGTLNLTSLPGNNALIVGNPTMPAVAVEIGETPTKLDQLPGSEQEANKIATFLNTEPLIGPQATRQAVLEQMSDAKIIHLATHGLLDDFKGQGVPGAIALAPDGTGERNDGLLTSNEILNLKLKAELVVLSACDTGRGEITGDGVIGLSRSLILAGVPSIVVSLWAVDDYSTAFLMSEFYKNWQETGDKAQSLRQAMLATMENHPDPKDWAAFTLIGEAE